MSAGAGASDHREAPEIWADAEADIADFYAFLNPNDASKLVLVMDVNAFSSTANPITYQFSPDVLYEFDIDADGDANVDKKIKVRFSPESGTSQTFQVSLPTGGRCDGNVTLIYQYDRQPPVDEIADCANGVRVFAGLRDDPFFFDAVASARLFAGLAPKFSSGIDRIAGTNISALVIELPLSMVQRKGKPLQLWSTTHRKTDRGWRQVQRVGNPAFKPVFIPLEMRKQFNEGKPCDDKRLYSGIIEQVTRTQLGGTDANVALLQGQFAPDTIKLDPKKPIVWPNGRKLSDDLDLVFAFNLDKPFTYAPGNLDGVTANDVPFVNVFPYLGLAHIAP